MAWAVLTAAFLASAVEFVEAFTIVLVVGLTINWRSSLAGVAGAALTLALLVAALGAALIYWIPLALLRLVIGLLLILFGLKWLKKAILRYSGLKPLHDEEAIFEEKMAELRRQGELGRTRFEPFGVALSYKAVLLEGLEVAFIVITFGSSAVTASCGAGCAIGTAALGAAAAGLLVVLIGLLLQAPLKRVPENTLKFLVGIMLTTFGTFWSGEGLGLAWPLEDAFLVVLAAFYLLVSFLFVLWLKGQARRRGAVSLSQAGLSRKGGQ
ncbi:COG4280 domain-containing protein [Thermogemmatispora sp.]|uniref:COG4280 domain-containing protein n=1 Tax=Thermogemmatispora sp. TaxID=1968838 RepID=UPI0035E458C5